MRQRVRNGKIARLPAAVRIKVNLMLRDNLPTKTLLARLRQDHAADLKEAGIDRIDHRHLSSWRRGGFADWERQQERLEEMKVQQEFALELARRHDNSLEQAGLVLAASQICEILQDFDLDELKAKLQEKPELYSTLIDALSKLSRARLDERKLQLELTKYRDRVAEQKRKIEQELGAARPAGGLTPETIARIQDALSLL